LFLIPLVSFGTALGDVNNIGQGFESLDYDEVVEFNKKYQKTGAPDVVKASAEAEKEGEEFDNSFTKKEIAEARF